jgi:Asp/Glu/hydantoin racemase
VPSPAARIALIHATALAVEPIAAAFERLWPEARRMNLLDDSLSVDLARAGRLDPAMIRRFVDLARYARRTGCDGILFTCSAFGPAIEAAAAAVDVPTFKPNEAMFDEALGRCRAGGKLGLVATFEPSLAPMAAELTDKARQAGLVIELRTAFAPQAMQDLAEGRAPEHHRKVAQAARQLSDCDAVMLAQFSMAAAAAQVQAALSCPVLSSPDCAVLALRKRIADA